MRDQGQGGVKDDTKGYGLDIVNGGACGQDTHLGELNFEHLKF